MAAHDLDLLSMSQLNVIEYPVMLHLDERFDREMMEQLKIVRSYRNLEKE